MDKQEFVNSLSTSNLAPLWEVYEKLVINEPARSEPSVIWKWADMAPQIQKSAELVHGKDADHRVLLLNNPHLDGPPSTTSHIIAAFQCVLAGEQTSAHRHTPAAIRVILEGEGGATFVDGRRLDMYDGDLIITPNWTWHCHQNDSPERTVWLDVLDLPLVGKLDAVFGELSKPDGDAYPDNDATLRFPWKDMQDVLDEASPDAGGMRSVDYSGSADGAPLLPTLTSRAVALAAGGPGETRRSMANELCVVLEGEGESRIGDVTHAWGPKDVFTVPHWSWARHQANGGVAHMIVISDREIMKRLDLYREETA
ncbi:MAG: cupin domain-containing protein [Rhodospirillales bacterium]|jgi:gentisate 1,2-dioxygenase